MIDGPSSPSPSSPQLVFLRPCRRPWNTTAGARQAPGEARALAPGTSGAAALVASARRGALPTAAPPAERVLRGDSWLDLLQPGLGRRARGGRASGPTITASCHIQLRCLSALSMNSMPSAPPVRLIVRAEKFTSAVASRNSRSRRAKNPCGIGRIPFVVGLRRCVVPGRSVAALSLETRSQHLCELSARRSWPPVLRSTSGVAPHSPVAVPPPSAAIWAMAAFISSICA